MQYTRCLDRLKVIVHRQHSPFLDPLSTVYPYILSHSSNASHHTLQLIRRPPQNIRRHLQLLLRKLPVAIINGIADEGVNSGVVPGAGSVGGKDDVLVLVAARDLRNKILEYIQQIVDGIRKEGVVNLHHAALYPSYPSADLANPSQNPSSSDCTPAAAL